MFIKIYYSVARLKEKVLILFDFILISKNASSRSNCDNSKFEKYLKRARINVFILLSFRLMQKSY